MIFLFLNKGSVRQWETKRFLGWAKSIASKYRTLGKSYFIVCMCKPACAMQSVSPVSTDKPSDPMYNVQCLSPSKLSVIFSSHNIYLASDVNRIA